MSTIDDVLAVATAAFAVATFVIPPVRYALSFRKGPRDSLSVVGRVIGLFVLTAILSAVAVVLALLMLMFSERFGYVPLRDGRVYWFAVVTFFVISDNLARRRRQQDGGT